MSTAGQASEMVTRASYCIIPVLIPDHMFNLPMLLYSCSVSVDATGLKCRHVHTGTIVTSCITGLGETSGYSKLFLKKSCNR